MARLEQVEEALVPERTWEALGGSDTSVEGAALQGTSASALGGIWQQNGATSTTL